MTGEQWISFLRQYGPIPAKDNLYDENLRRRSKRLGISQILFEHPYEERVLRQFVGAESLRRSVILTGTAGDGKTFLCGRMWEALAGDSKVWESQEPYLETTVARTPAEKVRLHVMRDLSAWVPAQGSPWPPEKLELMLRLCSSLFDRDAGEVFLIAANDGQLAETMRRLPQSEVVDRAKEAIEELLVTDREDMPGCRLALFNLSRGSSAELFERALDAFLGHTGWDVCRAEASISAALFGSECPIRRNYELLGTPLVRQRMRALLELCDQNGFHVPVRQILILLTNSVLGHKDAKDNLMTAADVPRVIAQGTRHLASVYNNIFGGNLPETRRANSMIFDYLERFQIGRETSNRVDNILIFGDSQDPLRQQYEGLIKADRFYGADAAFEGAREAYIEGAEESPEIAEQFLSLLVAQRRALFFKIPEEDVDEIRLWELTVFRYGGEYLDQVLAPLQAGRTVRRSILGRLVRGLNRIFTGMLINAEDDIYLASSASLSQSRVSRFLEEAVSVEPRHSGERVDIALQDRHPHLRVCVRPKSPIDFQLTLTRFEYLSRVAEGAMPNSFSKECFEDVMALKGQLMRELQIRNQGQGRDDEVAFRILEIDGAGAARTRRIGVQL